MSEAPEKDQKTEEPTEKRKREAIEKGDVLQSKELGTAMVVLAGAAWIAMAGPWLMSALQTMIKNSLSFNIGAIEEFDPFEIVLESLATIAMPLVVLFGITIAAAIGTPALLGSLGFRWSAIAFKPDKLNPLSGIKRIFGMQGLMELGKSLTKVVVLGAVGVWILNDRAKEITTLGGQDIISALSELGYVFSSAVLIMGLALAFIAGIDIPAQIMQRSTRLRMSKQEVKDESKETQGSPETKSAQRRRAHEILSGSARSAVAEATVVLTNPTHFAVALRYRPGFDAAPVVVARGRGTTAEAIRELAKDNDVPLMSYPALARAIYFTSRAGQVIQEDLFIGVATILAFIFNIDTAMARGISQPKIDVPPAMQFDENGNRSN